MQFVLNRWGIGRAETQKSYSVWLETHRTSHSHHPTYLVIQIWILKRTGKGKNGQLPAVPDAQQPAHDRRTRANSAGLLFSHSVTE